MATQRVRDRGDCTPSIFPPPNVQVDIQSQFFLVLNSFECSCFQIELDKTAEEFRKAHGERQELLRQWENTIEQMQKRDREMDQLAVVCYNAALIQDDLTVCPKK